MKYFNIPEISHSTVLVRMFLALLAFFQFQVFAQESESLEFLELQLMRPLSFPKILINEASQEGNICVANGMKNPANSLCPNKQGQPVKIKITGSPNMLVNLNLDSPPQEMNGLKLHITGTPLTFTLDANGKKKVELDGVITLQNRHQVKDGKQTFSYDITIAYQ